MTGEQLGELTVAYERAGKGTRVVLTAQVSDQDSFTDKVDIAQEKARAKFVDRICERWAALDREDVEEDLERIARQVTGGDDRDGRDDDAPTKSTATILVELVLAEEGVQLFHGPGGADAEPYISLMVDSHRETRPLTQKAFRHWLAGLHYKQRGKAASANATQDALSILMSKACYEGSERAVSVRLAEHEGEIWLDLCRRDWSAVRIGRNGWEVVDGAHVPVHFLHKRGMLELPEPVRGGSVHTLRQFVNVPDDKAWTLIMACIVAYLRPRGPYPVLVINGEHGSAKSTLSRLVRLVVDPSKPPLRRPPKSDRDLMIAASNGWIVAYDNLSGLPLRISDSLCCLATGGGHSTRQLYSDDDEKLFDVIRPVLLNGIEDVATRPDLMDRGVNITLPTIPEHQRRDEATLMQAFERARPSILGAFLDAVSVALRRLEEVRLDSAPRMADFARWATAAEPGLGLEPGQFMEAYTANRGAANDLALESSPIGPPLMRFMEGQDEWSGTCGELLDLLTDGLVDDRDRAQRDWPKKARGMRAALQRVAPNLRLVGIDVSWPDREPGGTRRRLVRLKRNEKPPAQPAQPSQPAQNEPDGPQGGDPPGRSWDGSGRSVQDDRPEATPAPDPENADRDGRADRAGCFGATSDEGSTHSGERQEVLEWRA